jgi:hypothetical protein
MNRKIRQSALSALTVVAVFLTPCAAVAAGAATKVDVVDKPKHEDLLSPDFSGVVSKNMKLKNWLQIEAKIKVQMKPEPKSKTCDRLVVKWYVAVDNPDKAGTYLKLTKEIEYVNVPLSEDVYCSVYLSPASIKRLTGLDRSGRSAVKFIGMEVIVDGKIEAYVTDRGADKWWTLPSDKTVESTVVPLLNKNETAFAHIWWDRYAEIKAKANP